MVIWEEMFPEDRVDHFLLNDRIFFCLSVDVQPPPGLAWDAAFTRRQTLLKWSNGTWSNGTRSNGTQSAEIYLQPDPGGVQMMFAVTGADFRPYFHPIVRAFQPGTSHNVKGCVSPAGVVTIYPDGVEKIGNPSGGATALDLAGGHLSVGGDGAGNSTSWNGYISKAQACFGGNSACLPHP